MSVTIEYFYKPTTWHQKLLARFGLGGPTCGILRGGGEMQRYGDPFEYAVAFCAYDHHHAELKALVGRSPQPSEAKQACEFLGTVGLTPSYVRRSADGSIRKHWRWKEVAPKRFRLSAGTHLGFGRIRTMSMIHRARLRSLN